MPESADGDRPVILHPKLMTSVGLGMSSPGDLLLDSVLRTVFTPLPYESGIHLRGGSAESPTRGFGPNADAP